MIFPLLGNVHEPCKSCISIGHSYQPHPLSMPCTFVQNAHAQTTDLSLLGSSYSNHAFLLASSIELICLANVDAWIPPIKGGDWVWSQYGHTPESCIQATKGTKAAAWTCVCSVCALKSSSQSCLVLSYYMHVCPRVCTGAYERFAAFISSWYTSSGSMHMLWLVVTHNRVQSVEAWILTAKPCLSTAGMAIGLRWCFS